MFVCIMTSNCFSYPGNMNLDTMKDDYILERIDWQTFESD